MKRRERRRLARTHGPLIDQTAPAVAPRVPPSPAPRRGLVNRARTTLVHRRIVKVLSAPAVAPLVAVAVVAVFAAVAVGAMLGALVVAAQRGDGAL